MIILRDLADNFFKELNPEFIKKKNGDVSGLGKEPQVKNAIAKDYIWFLTQNMSHYFDVEKVMLVWNWSDSKEIITSILREDQSTDVPLMQKLIEFLQKYYPSLTDISLVTSSCECKKVVSPRYDEYHEFYHTYTRAMTLGELSTQLEPYIPIKDYVDTQELIEYFAQTISAMSVSEYQAFILSKKLEDEMVSKNQKNQLIKI